MHIDNNFSHNYRFDVIDEVRNAYPIYFFPNGNINGGNDGIMVQIESEKFTWIGVFAYGNISKIGYNGVFSMPNANEFCVISKGSGYIVSANDPTKWAGVKSIPVTDVRISTIRGLIIFCGYTELISYDSMGVKWKTKQLSFDNLRIVGQSDSFLKGEYYDIRTESIETFEVNIETGEHIGSAGQVPMSASL